MGIALYTRLRYSIVEILVVSRVGGNGSVVKKKRGDTNRHIYAKNLAGKIPYFMLKYIDTALVSCK